MIDAMTTARVVERPTPTVPPSVLRPWRHAIVPMINENTIGLTRPPIKSSVVMPSRTAEMKTLDETEYSTTAVTQPPKIPSTSASTLNTARSIGSAATNFDFLLLSGWGWYLSA